MAHLVPHLGEAQLDGLRSRAEAKFFRACASQLDAGILVVHSLGLMRETTNGAHDDAEADFVIVHPGHGVLIVEVKGGGIERDPVAGTWTSVGATGRHLIKDPFRQAAGQKRALMEFLRADPRGRSLGRVPFGHAVFLPDLDDVDRLRHPSAPREILGGRGDLTSLGNWIERAFAYWGGQDPRLSPLGQRGSAVLEEILCKPVSVRPLISKVLADEEESRLVLTRQQSRLLRAISMRRRALISGGAGTGKTVLALERAHSLAAAGLRTLLLCFNRPLADHLKAVTEGVERLHTMTFHQLCDWQVRVARSEAGQDYLEAARRDYPGGDHWSVHLPIALALALDTTALAYDAIVIDEAQDFAAEFWLPIEFLLARVEDPYFYVFHDHNQALYGQAARPPVDEPPFLLTANCRNTTAIHEAAYRHYVGEATDAPAIAGSPIDRLVAEGVESQARAIASQVTRLVDRERVAPSDIAVLVLTDAKRPLYEAFRRLNLPKPASWRIEAHRFPDGVVVDTVARFKGLEAAVVFLCGLDTALSERHKELLYVGFSRAKSRVTLVGSRTALDRLVPSP